jgi:hypothetical protein
MSKTAVGRVAYRIYNPQLSLEMAVVVRDEVGALWAYPEDADTQTDPLSIGARPLEAKHLEAQPPVPGQEELPLFIYRVIFNVPPQPRFPPSLSAVRINPPRSKSVH